MKRSMILLSLFIVCIMMLLPLTSVAESSDTIDNLPVSKTIVINRLSRVRSTIKERFGTYNTLSDQGISIGCIMLYLSIILLTIINYIITGDWIPLPSLSS